MSNPCPPTEILDLVVAIPLYWVFVDGDDEERDNRSIRTGVGGCLDSVDHAEWNARCATRGTKYVDSIHAFTTRTERQLELFNIRCSRAGTRQSKGKGPTQADDTEL